MTKELIVKNEKVDDIPLLLAQMERMKIQESLDKTFPTHGHWKGLSLGHVTVIWLAHILSEGDHCLNHVQDWAEQHIETLKQCTEQEVRTLDFTDDRLADILRILSDSEKWSAFQKTMAKNVARVYDLETKQVRLDSTTISGYWEITPDGFFRLGHSKNHRPDLPQIKIMLSTLDPLGLPIVTQPVSGNKADDPLYIPAIKKVRNTLDRRGLTYIGDCKMAAQQTRAFVAYGRDFYLCPMPELQISQEEVRSYLAEFYASGQALIPVHRENNKREQELIAQGFEVEKEITVCLDNHPHTWTERHLVIQSLALAQSARDSLQTKISKAQDALVTINRRGRGRKSFPCVEPLHNAVDAILKRYHVQGLFSLQFEEVIEQIPVRQYGEHPATTREKRDFKVYAHLNEMALQARHQQLGWRVYASNQSKEQLSLSQAVLAYRNEYIIEQGFGRLKGRSLSISPMYLERPDHATGMIYLLSIALSILTLFEFVVCQSLQKKQSTIAGLYAGNPKRTTAHPSSEHLFEAFQNIFLTVFCNDGQVYYHITPLSPLQEEILLLSGTSFDVYNDLFPNSSEPVFNLSER